MATDKPRLTITLEPHTYTVLSELSRLQGRPKAKIITELLDTVVPVLERTCKVLQLAESASSSVTSGMKDSFEQAEAKLHAMFNQALDQMDIFTDELQGADESGKSASETADSESRSRTALPPHSNTGVTTGDKPKTPNKNKH